MARYKYTKNDLINNLRQLKKKLGRTPVERDLTKPSIYPYFKQFGTWNRAIKAAGMKVAFIGSTRKYTKQYLIKCIKEQYKKTSKNPTQREFEKLPNYPDPTTYCSYFGSWNKALIASGIKPNRVIILPKNGSAAIKQKVLPRILQKPKKSFLKRLFDR